MQPDAGSGPDKTCTAGWIDEAMPRCMIVRPNDLEGAVADNLDHSAAARSSTEQSETGAAGAAGRSEAGGAVEHGQCTTHGKRIHDHREGTLQTATSPHYPEQNLQRRPSEHQAGDNP